MRIRFSRYKFGQVEAISDEDAMSTVKFAGKALFAQLLYYNITIFHYILEHHPFLALLSGSIILIYFGF